LLCKVPLYELAYRKFLLTQLTEEVTGGYEATTVPITLGGRGCGPDRMVVGFTRTCTIGTYHHYVMSSNPTDGKVYNIM
jgi:hypothetical protein